MKKKLITLSILAIFCFAVVTNGNAILSFFEDSNSEHNIETSTAIVVSEPEVSAPSIPTQVETLSAEVNIPGETSQQVVTVPTEEPPIEYVAPKKKKRKKKRIMFEVSDTYQNAIPPLAAQATDAHLGTGSRFGRKTFTAESMPEINSHQPEEITSNSANFKPVKRVKKRKKIITENLETESRQISSINETVNEEIKKSEVTGKKIISESKENENTHQTPVFFDTGLAGNSESGTTEITNPATEEMVPQGLATSEPVQEVTIAEAKIQQQFLQAPAILESSQIIAETKVDEIPNTIETTTIPEQTKPVDVENSSLEVKNEIPVEPVAEVKVELPPEPVPVVVPTRPIPTVAEIQAMASTQVVAQNEALPQVQCVNVPAEPVKEIICPVPEATEVSTLPPLPKHKKYPDSSHEYDLVSKYYLGMGMEYFIIDSKDRTNGGMAKFISQASPTLEFEWLIEWDDEITSVFGFSQVFENVIDASSSSSKVLTDQNGTRTSFEMGIENRWAEKLRTRIALVSTQRIFAKALDTRTVRLDRIQEIDLKVEQRIDFARREHTAFGSTLSVSRIFGADGQGTTTNDGWALDTKLFIHHDLKKFPVQARAEMYYGIWEQSSNYLEQRERHLGANVGFVGAW
ncbi:MAG: hypothetical protein V4736_02885 [Bdellovibrionota bacterium]